MLLELGEGGKNLTSDLTWRQDEGMWAYSGSQRGGPMAALQEMDPEETGLQGEPRVPVCGQVTVTAHGAREPQVTSPGDTPELE